MERRKMIGFVDWYGARAEVWVSVTLEERWGERDTQRPLSIVGEVRIPGRPDVEACGQIDKTLRKAVWLGNPCEDLDRLLTVWDRWHLNDMRAGCEHQRSEGWAERPIDTSKPLNSYITWKGLDGRDHKTWNMLTWARRSEHPQGLLSEPCPVCGYEYGTTWLKEELPQDVLDWARAF